MKMADRLKEAYLLLPPELPVLLAVGPVTVACAAGVVALVVVSPPPELAVAVGLVVVAAVCWPEGVGLGDAVKTGVEGPGFGMEGGPALKVGGLDNNRAAPAVDAATGCSVFSVPGRAMPAGWLTVPGKPVGA
jgi:hypothetical protein